MKIFFTADYHLNHADIIRYCDRPFIKKGDLNDDNDWKSQNIKSRRLDEMNNTIIDNHNSKVGKDDIVYHVGDFCFKKGFNATDWESQLNGKIIHIKGNHDKNNGVKTYIKYALMEFGGLTFYVVHKPPEDKQVDTLESHIISMCDFILCGHVHNLWKYKWIEVWNKSHKIKKLAINVGVDVWGFEPITINTILKLIAKINKGLK